jgi:pimeloyl-ACP methyl ester carboxylesterase
MTTITANGIEIFCESDGPEDGLPILLTRGLGTQLIEWPAAFLDRLLKRGFRVLQYDNRDAGLSQKFGPCAPPGAETRSQALYSLFDMADDAVGLLDALGIEKAHVLGISMGGMISQIVAARYSERTASLISIMSSAGQPNPLSGPGPAIEALREPWPDAADRDAIIARNIRDGRLFGSRTHPASESALREQAIAAMERCYCPGGIERQRAAILAAGSREELLRRIAAPTLIIHGDEDPLIGADSGERAARLIPGAAFELIEGMGHDLPAPLIPSLVETIADFCRAADANSPG